MGAIVKHEGCNDAAIPIHPGSTCLVDIALTLRFDVVVQIPPISNTLGLDADRPLRLVWLLDRLAVGWLTLSSV